MQVHHHKVCCAGEQTYGGQWHFDEVVGLLGVAADYPNLGGRVLVLFLQDFVGHLSRGWWPFTCCAACA